MLNLNQLSSDVVNFNETPIKRGKSIHLQPHTAESDQPTLRSLEDIDPHDLFEKFNDMVKVSQDDEAIIDDFDIELIRKLDY